MLLELVVENYAVVERLRVHFHAGLNLLTGETGSGKSIVVDALGLLLGARGSAEMVRTGEQRARVAGIFDVRGAAGIRDLLEPAGLDIEDGELLVEREILAGGKSRAFVGSRPVSVSLLKELAPFLADIHGQHDQQLLFSAEAQRDLLDASDAYRELLERVAGIHEQWRAAAVELEELERSEQEKLRLLDLWQFQRKEIESAGLDVEEEAALENERRVLQNVQRLEEAASAAYAALYGGEESAVSLARVAAKRVDELCRIDDSLAELREHLKAVESRLEALSRLKRKYGQSVAQVLGFLEDVRRQIASVENATGRMEELRRARQRSASEFEKAAGELTERRRAAARKLERRVVAELAQLAMERTVFRVEVAAAAAWTAAGADRVEFLASPNLGEEPKALEKVASGGEISRIALALKTCLTAPAGARSGSMRTLVFDEVDAGVGGGAAEGIGRRLKKLASTSQVLCVTHLPQVASFADHHYCVEKRELNGRTVAAIEELDTAARTREIGRMLSGQTLTAEALKNAEQLIKMSVT